MRNFGTKVDNAAPDPSGVLTADEDNVRFNELKNAVTSAGIALDAPPGGPGEDLTMLAQALARYASGGVFGIDSGVANSYIVTAASGFVMPRAHFVGEQVLWYVGVTNTGPSQINAWSIGLKTLRNHTGADLAGGELVAGRLAGALWDPTLDTGAGGYKLAPWANALLYGAGGGGSTTTIENVGAGAGLSWKARVSGVDQLRSISGAGGIAVAVSGGGNEIVVDGTALGLAGFLAPFFPEVETVDNKLLVTGTTGSVVVGAGQGFVFRGQRRILTSDTLVGNRTFATAASKTYHLRWQWTAGVPVYVLKDSADMGYNPSSLAESSSRFDTVYDDMLVARVVTDAGNVPTITMLRNKHSLKESRVNSGTISGTTANGKARTAVETYDWGRVPVIHPGRSSYTVSRAGESTGGTGFSGSDGHDHDDTLTINSLTRYAWSLNVRRDMAYDMNIRVLMLA